MADENEHIVRHVRKPLTAEQVARLDALADVPDEKIDFSDIPKAGDEFFNTAVRGSMYHAVKHQITLRLDGDIIDWFRRRAPEGKGYQSDINGALRKYIADAESHPGNKTSKKAG